MKEIVGIVAIVGLISGCTPQPKPTIGLGTEIGIPQVANSAYGMKPKRYQTAIKNYFSTKLTRGESGQYKFGEPKRAYKQEGFAYGGELAWKGWLVETSVATPSRTGRYLTPRPYMVLFKGEQIVEHILGNSHKLVTKVDK
ncbi:MAG: Unknown protein [uncultured Sulfurovum sp.]|uniref:Lipoprotein n=1 Tax=uncultured Sulfurovum sp. TaxID=269237 RepID=A0A6S6TTN5_9BACT|nr:MAG: Unknown protein [uncultured Sulfurovum sp.]